MCVCVCGISDVKMHIYITLCSNLRQFVRILVVSCLYESKYSIQYLNYSIILLPSAPNIDQFVIETMNAEERLSVEEQQTQQQSATIKFANAITVTNFGDHVERKRSENNQDFINEYEVTLCVWYFFEVLVKMWSYVHQFLVSPQWQ